MAFDADKLQKTALAIASILAAAGIGGNVYQAQTPGSCESWAKQLEDQRARAEAREIRDSDECRREIERVERMCRGSE